MLRLIPKPRVAITQTIKSFSTTINLGHFEASKHQFGLEATLPLTEKREYQTISISDLSHYLHYTLTALNPEILEHNSMLQKKPAEIISAALGASEKYSVSDNLVKLRKLIDPTPEQKLLQRTLALIHFDLLDPLAVEKQNIRTIYQDLNLLDSTIMPEPRRGGANGFRSLKLYQDSERRVRFHIYPAGKAEDNYIAQDNLAHQHYGHSASILLAGSLVNQHFKATPTDDPSTELALYRVKPEHDPVTDPAKGVRSSKTLTYHQGVTVTRVSSHVYKAGEYYQLPKPLSDKEQKAIPYKLEESDLLDYHKVGNLGLTATLWTLKYPSQPTEYDFSVIPRTRPKSITVDYKAKNVDKKEFNQLLVETNHKIQKEIANINKISTVLDRGKRDLFVERVKYYGKGSSTLFSATSDKKPENEPTAHNVVEEQSKYVRKG